MISSYRDINANVESKPIPLKPQSIETVEFGAKSQKGIIQTLKEVFQAEPPRRNGSSRRLVFKQNVLDRMKDTYEMDIEIEVDFETNETMHDYFSSSENGTHGTHGTHYEDIDGESVLDNSDNIGNSKNATETSDNLEHSEIKQNNNNTEKSEGGLDPSYSQHVSQASQASQTDDCDLRNQEGADRFRAEVKRLGKDKNRVT
jgi:hypothetical protein